MNSTTNSIDEFYLNVLIRVLIWFQLNISIILMDLIGIFDLIIYKQRLVMVIKLNKMWQPFLIFDICGNKSQRVFDVKRSDMETGLLNSFFFLLGFGAKKRFIRKRLTIFIAELIDNVIQWRIKIRKCIYGNELFF